ncbi:MAG: hypothetical protein HYU66_21750 [Armatimonadetes bacterium]|nr:hypothetical protein [Armatimonadota bacterium]
MYAQDGEVRGTVALVLGVLSLATSVFLAIPAVIVANRTMAACPSTHPQYGLAKAGRMLGIFSLWLAAAVVGLVALWIVGLPALLRLAHGSG